MNWQALLPPRLRVAVDAVAARIDALQSRERTSLMLAALALAAVAEWGLVWPLHERRELVVAASQQAAQEQSDTAAAEQQAVDSRRSGLEATLRKLDLDLQRLGSGKASGEPLTFLFQRVLAREPARIQALRELAVEEIDAAALNKTAPAPDAVPAGPEVALYRNRFELILSGDPAGLVGAVRVLDAGARPLRIERVRLAATGPGGELRATVTLSVVSAERNWLSI